ncbi:hypothetical protein GWC95_10860 [Sediminibacterium roseum]|uniref:LPXTG-motif cell wall anchor domain-containing protein n=1 Tax=Sediminibacterium roseum TaxID=1978412 RepID=A0ABW9ZTU0_9BACT|nr:hypothetical protein [Sediminibacterium roseum]NCI50424.1 hypothetical protein [Sediminibacterium roseum]
MGVREILLLVVISLGAIGLIVFLVNRNRKDIKVLNPDSEDSTVEVHTDQERRRDFMQL